MGTALAPRVHVASLWLRQMCIDANVYLFLMYVTLQYALRLTERMLSLFSTVIPCQFGTAVTRLTFRLIKKKTWYKECFC